MEVILASSANLEAVTILFSQYRVFYRQPSNLEAARQFLRERFQANDSTVFLAHENGSGIGFIQLYPSFSSVSLRRIWILNDLFVAESYRQQRVAKLLLHTAENYVRESGAVRIILSTQTSNSTAQRLYESLGYHKDQEFHHYALEL